MTTAVMQALATGLPAITTTHSAFPDQIVDGKNGFMVAEGDYEALAEKILFYMDHPNMWAEMGRYGKEHTYNMYDSKILIDKQVALYESIIDSD